MASMAAETAARLHPIALGTSLLVYRDQASRTAFLRRWNQALQAR